MEIGVEIEMMEVVIECGVVECSMVVCMDDGVCLPPCVHHYVPLSVVD